MLKELLNIQIIMCCFFSSRFSSEATSSPGRTIMKWNTRKKQGWEKDKLKTVNNPVLLEAAGMDNDAKKVLKTIETELTKVKFACIGKVKI